MSISEQTKPEKNKEGTTLHTIPRKALLFHGIEEPQIGGHEHNPADEACHGRYIHKPLEDNHNLSGGSRTTASCSHIHQWTQQACEANCIVRRSKAIASLEKFGRIAVLRETIQGSRRNENASRNRRYGGRDNDCIDDRGERRYASAFKCDNKGRVLDTASPIR